MNKFIFIFLDTNFQCNFWAISYKIAQIKARPVPILFILDRSFSVLQKTQTQIKKYGSNSFRGEKLLSTMNKIGIGQALIWAISYEMALLVIK